MEKYLGFLLIFATVTCHATIYTQLAADGGISYSDMPSANSTTFSPPGNSNTTINTIKSVNSDATASTEENKQGANSPSDQHKAYTTFSIISPSDQETIQNQPVITVRFQIDPELQSSDSIQVYLDGNPVGAPSNAKEINLPLVERGTHQVSAKLLDGNNNVLKESNSITIYVHRASANSHSSLKNRLAAITSILAFPMV